MATILEGLNKLSGALGGAETATENLEALNAIAGALGGETTATSNADAIDQIAEHASGGGGGDFKLVEVTVINNSSSSCECELLSIIGNNITPVFSCGINSTKVVQAVLYKAVSTNGHITTTGDPVALSFSGDIEDDGDGYFIVSGAGTVTITDAS